MIAHLPNWHTILRLHDCKGIISGLLVYYSHTWTGFSKIDIDRCSEPVFAVDVESDQIIELGNISSFRYRFYQPSKIKVLSVANKSLTIINSHLSHIY